MRQKNVMVKMCSADISQRQGMLASLVGGTICQTNVTRAHKRGAARRMASAVARTSVCEMLE